MRCMICGKFFPEPNLEDIQNRFCSDVTYGICKSCYLQYPVEKIKEEKHE